MQLLMNLNKENNNMEANDLQSILWECLTNLETAPVEEDEIDSVTSFQQAGVLSNNPGLVVRVGKREFQISIVRSK